MNISLIGCGVESIEIGEYGGMTLDKAKEMFLNVVRETGNVVENVHEESDLITIRLKFDYKKNKDLLYKVADVGDLHGDAPNQYVLEPVKTAELGKYVRTNYWFD